MNLTKFDDALDEAKKAVDSLQDSQTSDAIMKVIHAIDLLADEVNDLDLN